jgi:hypothetical protein
MIIKKLKTIITAIIAVSLYLTLTAVSCDIKPDNGDDDDNGEVVDPLPEPDEGDKGKLTISVNPPVINPKEDTLVLNSQTVIPSDAVVITFKESGVEIHNPFESIDITNNNGHLVIKPSSKGNYSYYLQGVTKNGSVEIHGENHFKLTLNGTIITSPKAPAIALFANNGCSMIIEDKTSNRLIDGNEETNSAIATIICYGPLYISGKGYLQLRGIGGDAIRCEGPISIDQASILIKQAAAYSIHSSQGDINIAGGYIKSLSSQGGLVASHPEEGSINITGGRLRFSTLGEHAPAIEAAGNLTIANRDTIITDTYGTGSHSIYVKGKTFIGETILCTYTLGNYHTPAGIYSEGDLNITDGKISHITTNGSGIYCKDDITINGGTISAISTAAGAAILKSDGNFSIGAGSIAIHTESTYNMAIYSKGPLAISGGMVELTSFNTSMGTASTLDISGGSVYCYSLAGYAMHSDDDMTFSGGLTLALGSDGAGKALSTKASILIKGGRLVAAGGKSCVPNESGSTQQSVIYNTTLYEPSVVAVKKLTGNFIAAYKATRKYQSVLSLLISAPEIVPNTTYELYLKGTVSGSNHFHNIYFNNFNYTIGFLAKTVTTNGVRGGVNYFYE